MRTANQPSQKSSTFMIMARHGGQVPSQISPDLGERPCQRIVVDTGGGVAGLPAVGDVPQGGAYRGFVSAPGLARHNGVSGERLEFVGEREIRPVGAHVDVGPRITLEFPDAASEKRRQSLSPGQADILRVIAEIVRPARTVRFGVHGVDEMAELMGDDGVIPGSHRAHVDVPVAGALKEGGVPAVGLAPYRCQALARRAALDLGRVHELDAVDKDVPDVESLADIGVRPGNDGSHGDKA